MKKVPIKIVNTQGLPYSSVLEIKGTIFSFSGVLPKLDENKKPISLTLEEQTKEVLAKMKEMLNDCGLSFDNIFDVIILVHGGLSKKRYEEVNNIYTKTLIADGVKDMPDRALFGVYSLPCDAKIEIKFKAVEQ